MTRPSTTLHPSSAAHLAAKALALQGQYGLVSDLAREHGIRRQAVYDLRQRAADALISAFSHKPGQTSTLPLTEQDIDRAIVALRVMMPASTRDIQEVLPVLFNTTKSYGSVWNVLHAAETAAAQFNHKVDLSDIDAIALDEVFSQGKPVLSGIDLETGYVALLVPRRHRRGEDWDAVLSPLRDEQHLSPSCVVKDAGTGLSLGVRTTWPAIEERDDLFHAVYLMGQQQIRLERRAYKEIEEVADLLRKQQTTKPDESGKRRSIGQQLRAANIRMNESIERHDRYEQLQRRVERVLELSDPGNGQLRSKSEVVTVLSSVADEMEALGGRHMKDVATYLRNRADGLGLYLDALGARLCEASVAAGGEEVVCAVLRAYQASLMHSRSGHFFERRARKDELLAATRHLLYVASTPERLQASLSVVLPLLWSRHRASSAIENLHSVLRPYLVVQKHAGSGFLSLFQAYRNLRCAPDGRFTGTSAYERLTGHKVGDWLTLLGFPPSAARAAQKEARDPLRRAA